MKKRETNPGPAPEDVQDLSGYQPPQIVIHEFKPEKGFAVSTNDYPDGGDAW